MNLRPYSSAGQAFVLGLLLLAGAASAKEDPGKWRISGRVTYPGRGLPRGRTVRVEVSTQFPLLATRAERNVEADRQGAFSFDDLPAGDYWVVAYIDDDRDGHRSPGEISGFPRIAPIRVGPGHRHVRTKIELDSVHAIVATRFRPRHGKPPTELAFVALYVRDPATGAALIDAETTVEEDGRPLPLVHDPSFPGGAFVAFGEDRSAGERYVFTVQHPALGKAKRRVVLHARSLGAEPRLTRLQTAAPAGKDLSVEWEQPRWANFAVLELYTRDPLGGVRRVWPESLAAQSSASSPAVVPGKLLTPERRVRLEVVVGRADVRAESGEIWSVAAVGRELAPTRAQQAAAPAPARASGPPSPARSSAAPAKRP